MVNEKNMQWPFDERNAIRRHRKWMDRWLLSISKNKSKYILAGTKVY